MTLELIDGSYITPLNIFDVLDTVEEYAGVEVRQYLEEYFEDEEMVEDKDDHLEEVLENIEAIVEELERTISQKQIKRKDVQYHLDRLRATIQHEIGDK